MEGEVKRQLVGKHAQETTNLSEVADPHQQSQGSPQPHPTKQLLSVVSVMIAFVFVYNGISRLMELSTLIKTEFSVFSYAHSVEMMIIGTFLLLAECKTPLFKQNVKVIYRPFARVILLFIFSIFLYTGATELTDFYLVNGLTILMIMISQCVPETRNTQR